jgi:hypothetical protein
MKQLDPKQLGQDLVALGNRLSDIQSDAVQSLSTRVHGRPAETALLALCAGSILGFFLGLFYAREGSTDDSADLRTARRRRTRKVGGAEESAS